MRTESPVNSFMPAALEEARAADARGEVPVGAVVVSPDGEIVGRGGNETRALHDPSAHAEMLAIRRACRAVGSQRLAGFSIWVTLEPCPMCASGIAMARIGALYYGASDPPSPGGGKPARGSTIIRICTIARRSIRALQRMNARICYEIFSEIGGSDQRTV